MYHRKRFIIHWKNAIFWHLTISHNKYEGARISAASEKMENVQNSIEKPNNVHILTIKVRWWHVFPHSLSDELNTLQWIFRVQLNREREREKERDTQGKKTAEKKMSMDDYVAWFGHLSKLHSTDCEWKIMSRFYFIIFCLSIEKLIQSFHISYFLGPQCLHIPIYTAVYWINW